MYRALTLLTQMAGAPPEDSNCVTYVASQMNFSLEGDGQAARLTLDGRDLEPDELHTAAIDRNVSVVSAHGEVRKILAQRQRELASKGKIIVLGRDIGTVVLPDAEVKFFVTASVDIRARRRAEQRVEGESHLGAEIKRRDLMDSSRPISPLRPAPDAIPIDTGHLNIEESLRLALDAVESKLQPEVRVQSG